MVILIPIQSTIKMNDHSLLHVFYPLQRQSLAAILLEASKHLFLVLFEGTEQWACKGTLVASPFRCTGDLNVDFQR